MEWHLFRFDFEEGILAGKSAGEGRRLLLGLHGFGNDRDVFDPLFQSLPPGWRLVMIDLPGFGESTWTNKSVAMDREFLKKFLQRLEAVFPFDELHLMGFSMGGKYALGLFLASVRPVHSMTLISADGLRVHPLYRFCMYNPIGRRLFRFTIMRPGLFLFLLKVSRKLGIPDVFRYRFVKRQFEDRASRERLQNAWQIHSGIRPDFRLTREKSIQWNTTWHLIWGREDHILPVKFARRFVRKMPDAKLTVVEGGHWVMMKDPDRVREAMDAGLSAPSGSA